MKVYVYESSGYGISGYEVSDYEECSVMMVQLLKVNGKFRFWRFSIIRF